MKSARPFWNAKRVCSSCQPSAARGTMPCPHARPRACASSARAGRARVPSATRPSPVEDLAAERRQVLEEHRDQPLVARALPDQAVAMPRRCARCACATSSAWLLGGRASRSLR